MLDAPKTTRILRFAACVVGFAVFMSVRDHAPDRFWRGVCAGFAGGCLGLVASRQVRGRSVVGIALGAVAFGVLMGARDAVSGTFGRAVFAGLAVACLVAAQVLLRKPAPSPPRSG